MKRASEVVEQLISLAFDSDPEESDLKLAECLRLYAALVAGEAVSDAMSAGGADARPPSPASVAAQQVYEKDLDDEVPGLIDSEANDAAENVPPELKLAPIDPYDGLKRKYIVLKSDTGEAVENSFVLRPDKDPAAVEALRAYANATPNKTLAKDIINWVGEGDPPEPELPPGIAAFDSATGELKPPAPDTHTHTRRDPLRAKESCRTSWGAGLRRSAECSSGSRITESAAVWVPSPSWRRRPTAPLPPS